MKILGQSEIFRKIGCVERENGCGANLRRVNKHVGCTTLFPGSEQSVPNSGRSFVLNTATPQAELSLTDAVHVLNAGDRDRRVLDAQLVGDINEGELLITRLTLKREVMDRVQRITITAMLLSTVSMVGALAADSTAISCDFSIHKTEGEGRTACSVEYGVQKAEGEGTDYYAAHGIQKSEGEGGAVYTAQGGVQRTDGEGGTATTSRNEQNTAGLAVLVADQVVRTRSRADPTPLPAKHTRNTDVQP